MRFSVGPRPRILVPVTVVIDRLHRREIVVGFVFIGFHTVIDADGRHGHRIDNKTSERHPVVAVADTEVGLVNLGTVDAVADNHKDRILDVGIVE